MAGVDVAALFASAKTNPLADVSALLASAKGEPSGNKASPADTEQLEKELMRLVKSGEYEQLQRTIDEAKPIVNLDCVVGFDGNTPLHWAVEKGHLQCARVLCERGAKVVAYFTRDCTVMAQWFDLFICNFALHIRYFLIN